MECLMTYKGGLLQPVTREQGGHTVKKLSFSLEVKSLLSNPQGLQHPYAERQKGY